MKAFENYTDWCEICTYFDQRHVEYELSPIQWTIVERLLGLNLEEPYDDDFLTEKLLPAVLKALRES